MSHETQTGGPDWEARLGGYNRPGPVPRDEMWSVISDALDSQVPHPDDLDLRVPKQDDLPLLRQGVVRVSPRRGWMIPAMAAAAVLVVGIGIGRVTGLGPTVHPAVMATDPPAGGAGTVRVPGFQTLAADYLLDTEAFLTLLRADARKGQLEGDMGAWARSLLLQTRLLMETGQAPDPAVRRLLEDLELILVEVARIPLEDRTRAGEELKWIDEGMESQDVLPRLRAVAPIGAGMAGT